MRQLIRIRMGGSWEGGVASVLLEMHGARRPSGRRCQSRWAAHPFGGPEDATKSGGNFGQCFEPKALKWHLLRETQKEWKAESRWPCLRSTGKIRWWGLHAQTRAVAHQIFKNHLHYSSLPLHLTVVQSDSERPPLASSVHPHLGIAKAAGPYRACLEAGPNQHNGAHI